MYILVVELGWKTLKGSIHFFQYWFKLRCSILQHKNEQEGLSSKWTMEELDGDFLQLYWKQLQGKMIAKKIKTLLWLCSPRSLLIGAWL